MKMVFVLALGRALLFPSGVQARECLAKHEIRKMNESHSGLLWGHSPPTASCKAKAGPTAAARTLLGKKAGSNKSACPTKAALR